MVEVEIPFRDRAQGSQSKLRTVRDGFRDSKTSAAPLPRLQAFRLLYWLVVFNPRGWLDSRVVACVRVLHYWDGGPIPVGYPSCGALQSCRFYVLYRLHPNRPSVIAGKCFRLPFDSFPVQVRTG